MKLKVILIIALTIGLFNACRMGTDKRQPNTTAAADSTEMESISIPFTVADRYFVNNTVTTIESPKITFREEFDNLFGMAATMAENGQPTPIDFTKQFVIAVIKPESNLETTLTPISLQTDGNHKVVFTYRFEQGREMSYTTKPCLLIVVDKEATGEVVLNEIQ